MSPALKYTLGRIGLFVAAFLVLLPVPLNLLLKLLLALVISSALSWFVLRGWREQYSMQLQNAVEKRKTERQKLRSALAGEEEPDHPTDAAPKAAPDDEKPGTSDNDKQ